MTDNQIEELLKQSLAEVAPKIAAANPELSLSMTIKELGMDSVALMEMVGVIEEEVGVEFPEERLAQIKSLADLANFIRSARD